MHTTAAVCSSPGASLLAYFRDAHPPKYARYTDDPSKGSSEIPSIKIDECETIPRSQDDIEDEECGFWGEHTSTRHYDEDSNWSVKDVLNAIVYTLLIIVLVLNVDVVLARLGGKGDSGARSGDSVTVRDSRSTGAVETELT